MKKCSKCKVVKPKSAFGKNTVRKDGCHPYCLECRKLEYQERREHVTNQQRLRKFGKGTNWYDEKFKEQNGVCAVCGKPETAPSWHGPRSLAIDHNHLTGQIRGLLCNNCNNGLGRFKEEIQILKNTIKYLEYYNKLA